MNATGACVLLPNVAQWLDKENDGVHDGNCEGYSVLASHMYSGAIAPMTFGGANAFALTRTESLEQELMFWALSQSTVSDMVAPRQRKTPSELVGLLTTEFARGRAFGGIAIGVYGAEGGHSILPCALRRRSASVVDVLAHDNNHPNSERVLTLDGAGLTAASPSEVLFQGTGWTLGLEGVSIDPGQRDTLVIQPGAPDLLYRASGVETPTLTLAYQSAGDDYLIEVRSGSMTAGQNLRLSVDFAMNRARVSFDGSTSAPTFELYVERVSSPGSVAFDHHGVTASASSAMFVNFGSWADDTMPMSIGYDDDANGTIDRTATLTDEP